MILVGKKTKLPRNMGYQSNGSDYLRLRHNYQDQCTSQNPKAEPKQSRIKIPAAAKTLLAVKILTKFQSWESAFHTPQVLYQMRNHFGSVDI